MAESLLSALLEPGVKASTYHFLNRALMALGLAIGWMIFAGQGSIHVYILLALTAALFVSISWFMSVSSELDMIAPPSGESETPNEEKKSISSTESNTKPRRSKKCD